MVPTSESTRSQFLLLFILPPVVLWGVDEMLSYDEERVLMLNLHVGVCRTHERSSHAQRSVNKCTVADPM